jgi:hypothetical protein
VSFMDVPRFALGVENGQIVRFDSLTESTSSMADLEQAGTSLKTGITAAIIPAAYGTDSGTRADLGLATPHARPLLQTTADVDSLDVQGDTVYSLTELHDCALVALACELNANLPGCSLLTAIVCYTAVKNVCSAGPGPSREICAGSTEQTGAGGRSSDLVDLVTCPPQYRYQFRPAGTNKSCDVPCTQYRDSRRILANNVADASFLPACIRHDCCYTTCGSDRDQCHRAFREAMLRICDTTFDASNPKRMYATVRLTYTTPSRFTGSRKLTMRRTKETTVSVVSLRRAGRS